jgi:hypothetical protein
MAVFRNTWYLCSYGNAVGDSSHFISTLDNN